MGPPGTLSRSSCHLPARALLCLGRDTRQPCPPCLSGLPTHQDSATAEPIRPADRARRSPRGHLSWPDLQVTFLGSTQVAVGSSSAREIFLPPPPSDKHDSFLLHDPLLKNFLLQKVSGWSVAVAGVHMGLEKLQVLWGKVIKIERQQQRSGTS